MAKDILKQEITERSLVCYGVTSGDALKIGIVTGMSPQKDSYQPYQPSCWTRHRDLVQVTNLYSDNLQSRWFVNHPGKFLVLELDDEKIPFDVLENYYRLESKISEWTKANMHIHERDQEDASF